MPSSATPLSRLATPIIPLLLASAGCGSGSGGDSDAPIGPADAPVAVSDAAPTRPYRLASTGTQLLLDDGIQLGTVDLATDVDVVAMHQDFYGVPWDAFSGGVAPPPEWVAKIDQLVADAHALGKPVFLSLSPTYGGDRTKLAADVTASGTNSDWKPACYDLRTAADGAALRQAFAAYTTWMVERFDPKWVNVGIELNLFEPCGAAWDGMVDLERDAYAAAKAAAPDAVVFPSIQLDHLYGRSGGSCPAPMTTDECYDAHYAGLARLERDRFAISTYPYLQNGIQHVADIPSDWLTRAADRGGEQLVIAETGWLATAAAGDLDGTCVTAIDQNPTEQAAYFDLLIDTANARGVELIDWWSNRDVLVEPVMTDCPCDFDAQWCALIDLFRSTGGSDPTAQFYGEMLLKIFGTMGIRDYDGNPRQPIYDRWTAARALAPAPL